jgi:hypothetical protein
MTNIPASLTDIPMPVFLTRRIPNRRMLAAKYRVAEKVTGSIKSSAYFAIGKLIPHARTAPIKKRSPPDIRPLF